MLANIEGVLLDMDGVVHIGDRAIPGAAGALSTLESKGIPYRFLTNTTTRSRENLHAKMRRMGLRIRLDHIITTHEVALQYLENIGRPSCYLLVDDDVVGAYRDIEIDDQNPDCVVIGDIGHQWSYDLLNRIFNMIMAGASLVALHKGRYWQTEAGLQMDIGAFVAGLEYTTGVTATILGKPAATFFNVALASMRIDADSAVMVGDDIESDVGGAQRAGIRGVLVKTGKYRDDARARSSVAPDAVIESIADLPGLLEFSSA